MPLWNSKNAVLNNCNALLVTRTLFINNNDIT